MNLNKKRYCPQGHDTFAVGRTKGYCQTCSDTRYLLPSVRTYTKRYKATIPKERIKNQFLKSTYGITLDQYNDLFRQQNGLCLGCYRHQSQLKKALYVDHNHVTGKVRGLLCMNCNYVLGYGKDNPAILNRLSAYLLQELGDKLSGKDD